MNRFVIHSENKYQEKIKAMAEMIAGDDTEKVDQIFRLIYK